MSLIYKDGDRLGVTVTGAMSSGTRLLHRILKANPNIAAFHDESHGRREAYTAHVVVISRNPKDTDRSRAERWRDPPFSEFVKDMPTRQESETLLSNRYPDALRIQYEDLVADPVATIGAIADYLGLAPWICPEDIYDANAEWDRLKNDTNEDFGETT